MTNKYKIYMIVEYIKQFDFDFGTLEVLENLNGVLAHYHIAADLTGYEGYVLANELYKLALQVEFQEAAYLALA